MSTTITATQEDELLQYRQERVDEATSKKLKVLIIGKTGVGKSSFLNVLTGKNDFQSGTGKPQTQGFLKTETEKLIVWDSKGIEQNDHVGTVVKKFSDFAKTEKIDVLFVMLDSCRIENFHTEIIKRVKILAKCVLISRCDESPKDKEEFKEILEEDELLKGKVFMTSGKNNFNPYYKCPKCESEDFLESKKNQEAQCEDCGNTWKFVDQHPDHADLLNFLFENLDTIQQLSLLQAMPEGTDTLGIKNKYGVPLRITASVGIIMASVGGGAATAASPIPFSDWPLLLGNEVVTIISLAAVWGIVLNKADAWIIVKSIVKTAMVSSLPLIFGMAGKGIATVLKLIPVFGTAAGMAIDITVSVAICGTIGIVACVLFATNYHEITSKNKQINWEEHVKKVCNEENAQEIATMLLKSKNVTADVEDFLSNKMKKISRNTNGSSKYQKTKYLRDPLSLSSDNLITTTSDMSSTTITNNGNLSETSDIQRPNNENSENIGNEGKKLSNTSMENKTIPNNQVSSGRSTTKIIVQCGKRKRRMDATSFKHLISQCKKQFKIEEDDIKEILDQDGCELNDEDSFEQLENGYSVVIHLKN